MNGNRESLSESDTCLVFFFSKQYINQKITANREKVKELLHEGTKLKSFSIRMANFSIKSQTVSILGFAGYVVSVTTILLCPAKENS